MVYLRWAWEGWCLACVGVAPSGGMWKVWAGECMSMDCFTWCGRGDGPSYGSVLVWS